MYPDTNPVQSQAQPQSPGFLKGVVGAISDLLQVTVMSFAIFLVVYLFIFQPNVISGPSMDPTLKNREYVLTDKVTYRWVHPPERGEIIVFHSPVRRDTDYIKRIIGLPGDTVKVDTGKVYINGEALPEPYLQKSVTTDYGIFLREGVDYKIQEGTYIVMGDNRSGSSDSREWGPIAKEEIVGKAWFRYWPFNRLGLIDHK